MWIIVAENFYFVSFALEYMAYVAFKKPSGIQKMRFCIDLIQLVIVVWGLCLKDHLKIIFDDENIEMDNV